ncbi:MAG: hypothetical protein AB1598_00980 [Thermodesulfobacteriota bacterium]
MKNYFVYAILIIISISFSMGNSAFAQADWVNERLNDESGLSWLDGGSYRIAFSDGGDSSEAAGNETLYAQADETTTDTTYIEAPSKEWHFSIIPYLWMMGINGKVGVKGRTANVDVSFSQIFENLDFAAEVHMEAWRERFGFFIDATYSKIALTKNVSLRQDRTLNIKNVSQFFLGEFGGFYRVGTWPIGTVSSESKTKTSITFDLLGGGRYWWLEDEIDLRGPLGQNPEFSGSESWFDFIVGARAKLDINKFFIALRSDIGGFGFGFSSDISWNIAGYIGYELPWYKITPIIGYRALYDKYSNGSGNNRFLWDAWMYGPQIGIGFQF